MLNEQGHLDKARLRPLVFDNAQHRATINQLVHPRVREAADAFYNAPSPLPLATTIKAVLIPLLFESDTRQRYDTVWAVVTDEATLIDRLMARDNCPREVVEKKLATQWPQAKKAELSDTVIDNSGSLENTRQQVVAALQALCPEALSL